MRNVVYVFTCTSCQIQYVGETEQMLASRMNNHKTGIRQGSTEEYLHISCYERHRNVPMREKFRIQVAKKLFENDSPNKEKVRERLLEREAAWMFRLQTVFPLGFNSRIKGLGTVNHEGRYKAFNLYSLSVCFDRNRKKKR